MDKFLPNVFPVYGKSKLHTKFEVVSFRYCRNTETGPFPQSTTPNCPVSGILSSILVNTCCVTNQKLLTSFVRKRKGTFLNSLESTKMGHPQFLHEMGFMEFTGEMCGTESATFMDCSYRKHKYTFHNATLSYSATGVKDQNAGMSSCNE